MKINGREIYPCTNCACNAAKLLHILILLPCVCLSVSLSVQNRRTVCTSVYLTIHLLNLTWVIFITLVMFMLATAVHIFGVVLTYYQFHQIRSNIRVYFVELNRDLFWNNALLNFKSKRFRNSSMFSTIISQFVTSKLCYCRRNS